MKIPLSLLKTYLPLDLPIETICNTLTMLGIEVDSILNEHPSFANVIVGEVLSTSPHPNAEKLNIAQVHNGEKSVQVICGASNCRPGIKTAFAQVGSLIIDSDEKRRTIDKATIRGVESYGMLCSADELHLWKDNAGIMELPLEWETGKDLTSLLWDPVLELSLTPNLGHCLSALGIARELAAGLQKEIKQKTFPLVENQKNPIEKKIQIQIDDFHLTPRYMGRLIENVNIGPSPFWLQKELYSCGLKPINNVVDVTNYILIKTGHPMHAFDFDLIEGSILRISTSKSKEKWTGLDGVDREISPETLVISDAKKIVAAAGIMGGKNSAVSDKTKNIFLECAFFDPITIRKGAKKLSLRTDSAIRFEKGIDPNGLEKALDEAAYLIALLSGGEVAMGKIDLKKDAFAPKTISLRPARANQLLGTKLSRAEMENIFKRLECKIIKSSEEAITLEIPTYRFDIAEEIDLIEEIARLYGYNNIEKAKAVSTPSQIPNDSVYLFEKLLRNKMIGLGLQEFLTSDLISPKMAEYCIEFISGKGIELLKAIHAKTEEYSILRPSLLPGLLQVAKTNIDLKNLNFSAFEIGRIHFLQNNNCVEVPILSLLLTGKASPAHWSHKGNDVDFYTIKGMIENIIETLRIPNITYKKGDHISFHPGRQAEIRYNDLVIGAFGEIHPDLLAKADIKQRLYFAELDIEHLLKYHLPNAKFKPIPNLPSSERDWTVSLPSKATIESLFEQIQKHRPEILEKFELIDLYIPENTSRKNATFRFTYRDLLKTVSAEEVEEMHTKMVSKLLIP
jgi:phenylalanyl-tRNA synthetase beta chain